MRKTTKLLMVVAVLVISACAAPPKHPSEQALVQADHEAALAQQLDRNLEKAFGFWHDAVVDRVLGEMVTQLTAADRAFEPLSHAKVRVLGTAVPYVAPGLGNMIYVSRGALGLVSYENELAFLLAVQLAFLKEHVTARNLANLQGEEISESIVRLPTAPPVVRRDYLERGWFEPGALFDVGSLAYLKGQTQGIQLAYAAKYDPRGAVTLVQRWISPALAAQLRPLGKILPEPDERLANARDEVAKLSPLRNPIVMSKAFEELELRLQPQKKAKRNR